jgi:hypothetical protein
MTYTPSTDVLRSSGALRMTPARWITLAIGVPVILTLIGWTAFGVVTQAARASFPVSYANIPVQSGQLTVGVNSGDVTVRQGQGSTGRLTGTVNYTLLRPTVTELRTASGTNFNVNCRVPSGNCGLSATLDVPSRAGLTLSSFGGNLAVSGVTRSVNLTSEGGDVTVSGVAGIATVSTGGGNLTAGDLAGLLQFNTAGGDINGNDLTSPSLNAESGGGNVAVVFTKPPAYLNITSDGGDVTIVLPPGATPYNISTRSDGGDDSHPVPSSPSAADKIEVDSGGGNISIAEAS